MSLSRNVGKTLLTGSLACLALGLLATTRANAEPTVGAVPLYLIDSPFDPPAVTRIYTVDPATGVMALRADLGNAHTPSLALAAASDTVLYAGASDPAGTLCQGNSCLLLKIVLDPLSTTPQSVTVVGPFHQGAQPIGEVTGLTFRADGALYALSQSNNGIYIVDPTTASCTLVGISNVDLHGGDITFDADDLLWAWTNGGVFGFYELDPASAYAIPVDVTPPPDTCAGLAALGHTNTLYAASTAHDTLNEFEAGVGSTGIIVPLTYLGSAFDHKRGDLDSPACLTGSFCDDGNACTDDSCDPGGCHHAARAACCATAADCDDNNPCTQDACVGGTACTHTPVNGGQTTCGVGACQRSVAQCVAGALQSCQPAAPAAETCNGVDDDCDGLVDEDVPAPAGLPSVRVSGRATAIMTWTAVPGAFSYSVIRGGLGTLASSHGNFAVSVDACLGAHLSGTSSDISGPVSAGAGYWYLVRASSCSTPGTYNDSGPGLARNRDASIAASPAACP